MSTKSNSTKSNSTKSTIAKSASTPQQTQSTPARAQTQTMAQPTMQTNAKSNTTQRARKPVTIRVRATGEEIRRVPVERSGYRVVRYEGRYHTIRGGGRTAPYILGSEDSEDMLGRA